jgi:hypothetical protein
VYSASTQNIFKNYGLGEWELFFGTGKFYSADLFELGTGGAIEAFDVFFYFGGAVAGAKRNEGFKV